MAEVRAWVQPAELRVIIPGNDGYVTLTIAEAERLIELLTEKVAQLKGV